MNFDLSEDQQLLSEAVGKLFDAHAADPVRDLSTRWRDYLDMGLVALPFDAAHGGLGGGHAEINLVMEAYGRNLAEVPYLQPVLLAGRVLALAGDETARAAISDLLAGGQRHVLCLYEAGARYRWDAPATKAVRSAGGWTLDGRKIAVLDAADDTALICTAATPDGLGLFLVPAGAAGLSLEVRPTPDGRSAADVTLCGVEVAAEAAIGAPARNHAILAAAIDGAIAACCAEAVGTMEQLLAITVEYLGVRKQFGLPIRSFQALQHRAADMLIALEQARSMTIHAISTMDEPPARRRVAVAAAKALVNRSARFVGQQAIQLHGGMGLAAEYPAGRYFQRLTVLESLFGDTGHLLAEVERGGGLATA